jgi:hypothetical protein
MTTRCSKEMMTENSNRCKINQRGATESVLAKDFFTGNLLYCNIAMNGHYQI